MTNSESPTNVRARLEPALEILRANSEQADRTASLPAENIQALCAAGAMRWSLPLALGGDELSSVEKVDLWSAMGAADLCTIWIFANYDSQLWELGSRAHEPFPGAFDLLRGETAFCGTVAPVLGSVIDGDAVVINGRFPFATGWKQAGWMRSNILLPGPAPEAPVGDESKVHLRMVNFPLDRPEVRVEETWDAVGLRASQTDTVVVDGLRVPRAQAMPYVFDPDRLKPGFDARSAYYAEPGWALSVSRVAVSLAGCGMTAFERAREYVTGGRANQTGQPAARFPAVRACMTDAYAELFVALAAMRGVANDSDQRVADGRAWTPADEAGIWASGMVATRAVLRAVDQMSLALGATLAQRNLPFERYFRDIRTGALHLGVHPNLVNDRINSWMFPGIR
ncbi:MAG: acyl-CoA dehydrogenase family protein [Anaerolineaceae bacterium]